MPLGEFRPKSSFSLPFSYKNMQCFRGSNILNLPQSIFWNKAMVFCTKDDELKVKSRVEWGFRDLLSMTSLGCEQILRYPHIWPALDHFLAIRPDSHLTISIIAWYSQLKNRKFILYTRISTRNLTIFEPNWPDSTIWYLQWLVLD